MPGAPTSKLLHSLPSLSLLSLLLLPSAPSEFDRFPFSWEEWTASVEEFIEKQQALQGEAAANIMKAAGNSIEQTNKLLSKLANAAARGTNDDFEEWMQKDTAELADGIKGEMEFWQTVKANNFSVPTDTKISCIAQRWQRAIDKNQHGGGKGDNDLRRKYEKIKGDLAKREFRRQWAVEGYDEFEKERVEIKQKDKITFTDKTAG